MSSNYYFSKWRQTLSQLEDLLQVDLQFQNTKVYDPTRCEAVTRLNGILGRYIAVYNESFECLQENLQVQKTRYIDDVVKAVINRIIELKHQITKLQCSNIHFLSNGLVQHKLTTYDTELLNVPFRIERPESMNALVSKAFQKAKERKEQLRLAEEEAKEKACEEIIKNWWDEATDFEEDTEIKVNEIHEENSEESVQRKRMAVLIQSHERSRYITQLFTHRRQKRQLWEKELLGTLNPLASYHLRERSAKLMQKVFRAYFEIKRRKLLQCKIDELLGISYCAKHVRNESIETEEIKTRRMAQKEIFEEKWVNSCKSLREKYNKIDEFKEDYRDYIRNWFGKWFDEIQFFYDIPKEKEGGSIPIMKEELPTPTNWWDEYQLSLAEQKANKNRTLYQKKLAEFEARKEETRKKIEQNKRNKLKTDLVKKLMKNPKLHPGFYYPESRKIQLVFYAVQNYKSNWNNLDIKEQQNVKEGFVLDVDMNDVYAKIKMEVTKIVEEDMKEELKTLKNALKKDYLRLNQELPKTKNMLKKSVKTKKRRKKITCDDVLYKMEDLAFRGILKQYTRTGLESFVGEYNYAGDNMRCDYLHAQQYSGELRALWWEKCLEVSHGFHRILIIGPRRSGKTILVHALASLNDAILFEINLDEIDVQFSSNEDLQQIMASLVACARAAEPSVIYLRHVHRLYYSKVPRNENISKLADLKRIIISTLCKKMDKTNKITLIGTCIDPWLTKSSELLKRFPEMVLVPDTNYTSVVQLLKNWVRGNHSVPCDLNVQGLARVLQGYSCGYLKRALTEFLSPDRIVNMAAYGLSAQDIYDYILNDKTETKVNYEKYVKWYHTKTNMGKKETKHMREQLEFKSALEEFKEKLKKKRHNREHPDPSS